MKRITVVLPVPLRSTRFHSLGFSKMVDFFNTDDRVSQILLMHRNGDSGTTGKAKLVSLQSDSWISTRTMMRLLVAANGDDLLLMLKPATLEFEQRGFRELLAVAEYADAGLVYADYRQVDGNEIIERPTIDYQQGSIRAAFDFGPIVWLSQSAVMRALKRYGSLAGELRWNAFYDLRLKLSIDTPIVRAAEALYVEHVTAGQPADEDQPLSESIFCTQDYRSRSYQLEVEQIATDHLRRIGCYVNSGGCPPPASDSIFPVTASIVIPTRNRERTIGSAIESALCQAASFPFNVIVVDDHSSDRTAEIVHRFSQQHANIVHLVPVRQYSGIGGLWNEAIYSMHCGRYAVQLDSDDLFAGPTAVELLIQEFIRSNPDDLSGNWNAPRYAMVVGSYKCVNFDLEEIPPALNQRLDFSQENGRNNVLAIDGVGAPRAFYVPVLRQAGFPNISFGEDYVAALRLTRSYDIGRVYECVYLARQWEDNTGRTLPLGRTRSIRIKDLLPPAVDAGELQRLLRPLTVSVVIASANRNDAYKDYIRTLEIHARRRCQ